MTGTPTTSTMPNQYWTAMKCLRQCLWPGGMSVFGVSSGGMNSKNSCYDREHCLNTLNSNWTALVSNSSLENQQCSTPTNSTANIGRGTSGKRPSPQKDTLCISIFTRSFVHFRPLGEMKRSNLFELGPGAHLVLGRRTAP